MKAEERKEIETNSLVHAVQKLRERMTGRTLYYVAGVAALVIGGILLYRYLTGERSKTRDAALLQLISADTPEKLKQGMEDYRGTVPGSLFKLHLARHYLLNEGLPKLGTDNSDDRKKAANAVAEARTYYLDLTGELKEKDDRALVQEAWLGAAQAEEALVGLPTAEGGTDSRGSADKVIEYFEKAAAVFPDTEFGKRYKAHADKIKANKDQFVATQKAIYKPREVISLPPAGKNPFGPGPGPGPGPALPNADATTPKVEVPPPPAAKAGGASATTTTVPPPPAVDTKKTPEPKPTVPPKSDPKAK